jgi:hypothetical protein
VASFSVSPAEPAAGQAAKLTSTSSDADGVVTAVAWDLDGDGTYEATGPSVTKTFPAPGTYTIGVRATDDGKESSTASGQVTVGPPLPPGAAGAGLVRRNPDRSRLRCRWLHLGWHRYRYCAAPRKAHRRAARRHARHARRHAAR